MAKITNEQEGKETVEFFKDLDREALNTERFLEKYSKPLGVVFGLLILGVLGRSCKKFPGCSEKSC